MQHWLYLAGAIALIVIGVIGVNLGRGHPCRRVPGQRCDVAAEPVADRQSRNPLSRGFDPMAARW